MFKKRKPPEGREKALLEQFEKDRISKRENQKKLDAEYIKQYGSRGWLMSGIAEPTHQKIPRSDVDKPIMPTPNVKKAKSVTITNISEAMQASTGSGTILTLSYKTDVVTVRDGADNRENDFATYATSIDNNTSELETVRGNMNDIEEYFNELSGVLAENGLPHDGENDAAVRADAIRSDVGTIENMNEELKEKLEEISKMCAEAKEMAGEIAGLASDTADKTDNLANLIISLRG